MKTYSISVGTNYLEASTSKPPISFLNMQKGRALGAMSMADFLSYGGRWYFVMRCDQTNDIVETVSPRAITLNSTKK